MSKVKNEGADADFLQYQHRPESPSQRYSKGTADTNSPAKIRTGFKKERSLHAVLIQEKTEPYHA